METPEEVEILLTDAINDYEDETFTDLKLSTIDLNGLYNLILKNPGSPSIRKMLRMIYYSIIDQKSYKEPNMERIRLWMTPILCIHAGRACRIHMSNLLETSPFYCLKYYLNDNFDVNAQYRIGTELSRIEKYQNVFLNIIGVLNSTVPIYEENNVMTWFINDSGHKGIPEEYVPKQVLVTEYIPHSVTLDIYLREYVNNNNDQTTERDLWSIYFRIILGMAEAYNKTKFIHRNLICENILVRPSESLKYTWRDNVIIGNVVPVIVGMSRSQITLTDQISDTGVDKVLECGPIKDLNNETYDPYKRDSLFYDVYTFTASFIYNLKIKRSTNMGVKMIMGSLFEFLKTLGVPLVLLNKINCLEISNEILYTRFNKKITDITYDSIINTLLSVLKMHKIKIDNFYKPSDNSEDETLNEPYPQLSLPEVKINTYNLFQPLYSNTEPLEIHLKESSKTIHDKMSNIELSYNDIAENILILEKYKGLDLVSMAPSNLDIYTTTYVSLFKIFLCIRIFLDELSVILYQRLSVSAGTDVDNSNLENYIKENNAKVMRIVGENIIYYNNIAKVFDYDQYIELERIFAILNNRNIKTR